MAIWFRIAAMSTGLGSVDFFLLLSIIEVNIQPRKAEGNSIFNVCFLPDFTLRA